MGKWEGNTLLTETLEARILRKVNTHGKSGVRMGPLARELSIPYSTCRERVWDLCVRQRLRVVIRKQNVMIYPLDATTEVTQK